MYNIECIEIPGKRFESLTIQIVPEVLAEVAQPQYQGTQRSWQIPHSATDQSTKTG